MYAVVRTIATPSRPVTSADLQRFWDIYFEVLALDADVPLAEREANLELCRQFNLGFYEGSVGQPLKRVYCPEIPWRRRALHPIRSFVQRLKQFFRRLWPS
jgi:hypothetical protein